MKKTLLLLATLFCCGHAAMAVPAYKARKQIVCKDGTTLDLTLTGDENLSYWTDQHGRAVVLDQDGDCHVLTGFELEARRAAAAGNRARENARRVKRNRIGRIDPLFGKKRGLVILMEYQDLKFTRDNANEVYSDIFSKQGYSDDGFTGSVSDYFREQSYGQFEIEFDVAGPYTAKNKMSYYGQRTDSGNDINVRELIEEAMRAADGEVNYKDYDWDGDGEVEQVYVVYAGYGENFGADPNTIWPHESRLYRETPLMLDGVKLDTYACSCELRGTAGQVMDGIGTACHEFSHCLGFPDFYDVNYGGNEGTSDWDVLCSGSYNNMSRTPAAYTSYERMAAGWLTPKEVTAETVVSGMKALTDSPEAYIMYNERNRNEYYLLENRQQKGFDSSLPGHGLLVLHVDYDAGAWSTNTVNVGTPQRMSIIAADGNDAGNHAADPFPGTRGVTELTDVSTPAAVLNNKNVGGDKLMHKSIESIKEQDGLISMILAAPLLTAPKVNDPEWSADGTGLEVSWQPVDRADRYEIILQGNPGKGNVEDAVVLDEDFAGCYRATAGFSDIGSSLDKYTTNRGFTGSKLYQSPDMLRIGTSTTTGVLRTPGLKALATGDLTIVMNVKPLKAGTTVKGTVNIFTNTPATRQSLPLEFSGATTLVLHSTVKFNEVFRVDIQPESGMSISHLSLYDGNYSEEELGLGGKTPAPRRAAQELTVTTADTHYLFTGLDATYEYTMQIRAMEDDRKSLWSDVYTFSSGNGIEGVREDKAAGAPQGVYDLQGRKLAAPARKGIYIVDGKKVVM